MQIFATQKTVFLDFMCFLRFYTNKIKKETHDV